ncbi:MAG: ABC-F family ATP-binding cassette domain-containing protein [Eubacterium sp.]|jgi:ATP-binding cassette subfamily F protein 3|nr:ABC-F family ATP-binding cassette domain-containing protein [Eubacterium sp.]
MVLACSHIHKSFNDQIIFSDATFHINEGERAALVGSNGAGKTTLLRIIVGELPADGGEITTAKDKTIGYLPQQQGYHSEKSIYEELLAVKKDIVELDQNIRAIEQQMPHVSGSELESLLEKYHRLQTEFEAKDGYACKSQIMGIINGLGFNGSDVDQCINTLSGGQKTRVALGKLLLLEPDLLILDEPTNHLDLSSIEWLENYLANYKGSVLIVSHDRYFLDRIAEKVIEVDHGKITVFSGNYSDYAKKKEQLRNNLRKQYENYERTVKHQEAVIEKLRSFNREKSIRRAESREKMLDKLTPVEKPAEQDKTIHFELSPEKTSGNDVLFVEDFAKSFGENHLFEHVTFDLRRGQRAAIIGKNGTGKTTLLKILCQELPPDRGSAKFGTNVEIGYYDQEHNVLHEDKTIFDEIHDDYPDLNNTKIRNVLAAFLFTGDDVYKKISLLSGGEKGRVSLAKLMLSKANLLLLDEPTNHLDIESKEILEEALNNYTGTVLFVSHDRYFIQKTATKILDLTGNALLSYDGDYVWYLEKKETVEKLHLNPQVSGQTGDKPESDAKLDWKEQKEREAKRRKIENSYNKTEEEIHTIEQRLSLIDDTMSLPEYATDVGKLTELAKEKEQLDRDLEIAMEAWETYAEQLEQLA